MDIKQRKKILLPRFCNKQQKQKPKERNKGWTLDSIVLPSQNWKADKLCCLRFPIKLFLVDKLTYDLKKGKKVKAQFASRIKNIGIFFFYAVSTQDMRVLIFEYLGLPITYIWICSCFPSPADTLGTCSNEVHVYALLSSGGQSVLKNIPTLKCDLGEMSIVGMDVYSAITLNSHCL